eukprot:scaffold35645_cov67-Isochrysis_galbana.AAC.1
MPYSESRCGPFVPELAGEQKKTRESCGVDGPVGTVRGTGGGGGGGSGSGRAHNARWPRVRMWGDTGRVHQGAIRWGRSAQGTRVRRMPVAERVKVGHWSQPGAKP